MFNFESIKMMEFDCWLLCVQSQFRSCSNFENSVGGMIFEEIPGGAFVALLRFLTATDDVDLSFVTR